MLKSSIGIGCLAVTEFLLGILFIICSLDWFHRLTFFTKSSRERILEYIHKELASENESNPLLKSSKYKEYNNAVEKKETKVGDGIRVKAIRRHLFIIQLVLTFLHLMTFPFIFAPFFMFGTLTPGYIAGFTALHLTFVFPSSFHLLQSGKKKQRHST